MKKRIICFSIFIALLFTCLFVKNKQVKAEAGEIVFDTVFNNSLFEDSNELNSGAYYLESDISFGEGITIPSGNTVYLDIKGHKFNSTLNYSTAIFNIEEGATLKVYDSGTNSRYFNNNEGEIVESNTDGYYYIQGGYFTCNNTYPSIFYNLGTLEVNNVSFIGINTTSSLITNGSYDHENNKVGIASNATLNNCEFYLNKAGSIFYNYGILECNSCLIYENELQYHVICTYNDVLLSSCDIRENKMYIATVDAYEGNVLINGDTNIVNNYNTSDACGAVYIRENASVTLGERSFIRENYNTKYTGDYIERNVVLESNTLLIETNQEGNGTIEKGFSVGLTLLGEDKYNEFDGVGVITASLNPVNYSNYFLADNYDYIVVGRKDGEDDYSLYYEKIVVSQPTEESPIYKLNLDDNDEVFYNWFKVKRSADNFYFDDAVKAQKGVTYSSTPGKFTIDTSINNHSIEFDSEAETILSFDVLKDENITSIRITVFIDGKSQAVINDYSREVLANDKHYEFTLEERGHYKLTVTAYDSTYASKTVEIENLYTNSLVPDYDNVLDKNTNDFGNVLNTSGKYICEVIVGERNYQSEILSLKSKIAKEPTTDDPSIDILLEDENSKVEYKWYYYSYEEETTRWLNAGDVLYGEDSEGEDSYFSFYNNGYIGINLKKGDKLYPIIDESNDLLKKYYQNVYVTIYKGYSSKYISLFEGGSFFSIDEDEEYEIKIYFNQNYEEYSGELDRIDMMFKIESGGYQKEFLLENETSNTLNGSYPLGLYACEITIDDKLVLYSKIINFGIVNIKTQPTEDDLTFEMSDDNFGYQWYFTDGNISFIIPNATSKTLDPGTLIGTVYCIASCGDLSIKSKEVNVSYRIIKQPTKDDTTIKLNTTNEKVYYKWYEAYYDSNDEEWYPNYECELENENDDHIYGSYPYGNYICDIVVIKSGKSFHLVSDAVTCGDLEYERPSLEDPTIIYKNDSGVEEEISWYHYGKYELKDYTITDKDFYNSSTFLTDSWCYGEYINNKWFLSKDYMDMNDVYDGCPVIAINLQEGAKLKINASSDVDSYFMILIVNFDDLENMVNSETAGKSFEYTFTCPEVENGESYIFIYACNEAKTEMCDIYAEIVIDNMTIEDYLYLKDEKTATLSSKETRLGWYLALLKIGDYKKEFYLNYSSRILESPNKENDYTVKVISDADEVEYKWYKIVDEREKLTSESEFITLINATYEDGIFYLSSEGADLNNYGGNMHKLRAFSINAKEGNSIFFNISNEEANGIYVIIKCDGNDVFTAMNFTNYLEEMYTFENDGEYYFYSYGVDSMSNTQLLDVYIEASYGKYERSEVTENANKESLIEDSKTGYYDVEVTFKFEEGNEYSDNSDIFFYCAHSYEVSYEWNETNTKVIAKAICTECKDEIVEEADVRSEVLKESTCKVKGSILYSVVFENELFEAQTNEVELDLIAHSYEVSYEWNETNTKVIAKAICTECEDEIDEEADTTSEVLKESTCTTKGLISFSAVFTNELFEAQTKEDELDVIAHSYEVSYEWNETNTKVKAKAICTECEDVTVEEVDVRSEVLKESTCTTKGIISYSAIFKNELFEAQTNEGELDLVDHSYEVSYEWNETNTKVIAKAICTECEDEIVEEVDTTSEVLKESTCITKGLISYNAVFKNELFEAQTNEGELDLIAHSYEVSYEWNETNTKVKAKAKCIECEDEIVEEVDVRSEVLKESTCTTKGIISYSSVFTNELFEAQTKEDELDVIAHSYEVSYEWNETNTKVIAKAICTECEDEIVEEVDVRSEVLKESTCTTKGIISYSSVFTNELFEAQTKEEESDINPNNHSMIKFEATLPTSEEEGNIEYYTCSHCNKFFKDIDGLEEVDPQELILEKIVVSGCKSSISTISSLSIIALFSLGVLFIKKKRI